VSVLLRKQGYGQSPVRNTVMPQITRNPRTMPRPNRMNTMGMTLASIPQAQESA